ncbi:hypothetical protein D3C72_1056570 [compost metagenome]
MRGELVGGEFLPRLHVLPGVVHRRAGAGIVRLRVVAGQLFVADAQVGRDIAQQRFFEARANAARRARVAQLQARAREEVRDFHPVDVHVLRVADVLRHGAEVGSGVVVDGLRVHVAAAEGRIHRFGRQVRFDAGGVGGVHHGALERDVAELLGDPHFLQRGHHGGDATALIRAGLLEQVDHLHPAPGFTDRHALPQEGVTVGKGQVIRVSQADVIGLRRAEPVALHATAHTRTLDLAHRRG